MAESNLKFRLRLHFDDNITFGEDEDEKRKCWFLCHKKSTISDLSSSIMKDFNLKSQCPHGITLYLEQFALISSQTLDILRETDIVTVKKKITKKREQQPIKQPEAKKPKMVTQNETSSSEESSEEESDDSDESSEDEAKKPTPTTKTIQSATSQKAPPKQETTAKATVTTKPPQKNTAPAAKQTAPKPQTKTTPVTKKVASDSDSSDSSEEESPKANGNKATSVQKPTTPAKQTQSKTHIKFDEKEEQPNNTEVRLQNNAKPPTTNKPNNTRHKTAIQQQDRLENVSVLLHRGTSNNNHNGHQKSVKLKPIRDYNTFPILQQTDAPQRGDLLAFNMLDLCAWNPEVVRKEGVVESYNAKEDTITIRIDTAFQIPKKLNVPQSMLKAQSKENRYLTFKDWDDGGEGEEEEESETDEIVTVSRADLLDIRIIERKGHK